jgi:DNA polymerase-3 subunit epsilon
MEEISRFAAIDFETAHAGGHSACAVAIVTMENHVVTDRYYTLIQPPNNHYYERFCGIHGIYPSDTADAPTFDMVYNEIHKRLQDQVVVAHNEGFDRKVLSACMLYYDLSPSMLELHKRWECTVKIYRKKGFKPCNLHACCSRLNIPLVHHHALSDAEACARLYALHLQESI